VNSIGTANVIEAAKMLAKKKEKKVILIYISSSAVVFNGSQPLINAPETMPYPTSHLDHYGRTKLIAEKAVLKAHRLCR